MHELLPWLRLIAKAPRRLVIGGLLIFLTLLSGIGLLALSGWFITATALAGLLLAAGMPAAINLYVPGGGIRLFAVTRTVGRYLERVYNHDTVLRLLTDIRVALFTALARVRGGERSRLRGAQWLSRLTSDVEALDTLYLRLIAPAALAVLVTVLLVIATAFVYGMDLALSLGLALVLALLVCTVGVYLRTRSLASEQVLQKEHTHTAVIEHLEGFGELTAAGRVGKHGAFLLRRASRLSKDQADIERRTGWNLAIGQILVNGTAVLALWMGLELFHQESVSGPMVVLLPIALLGLLEIYSALPDAFGKLGSTIASAFRLNRDCAAPGWPPQGGESVTPVTAAGQPALQLADVTLRHGHHPPLLRHFDLSVMPGECIGIVGASGSGKSSLADAIAGLLEPASGRIQRTALAYLTQKTVLFDDTLRANLIMGKPDATATELWRVLELVALGGRFADTPEQLDTWVGAHGYQLSGGEARRVALARVLLNEAPLLVLDEPFTGVDSATRDIIGRRLAPWIEGKAVVYLGHSTAAFPAVDRWIHL